MSNTYSHAKNRNDPRPITLSKVAVLESGFSAVAILGGGWLQSPASDGPPWSAHLTFYFIRKIYIFQSRKHRCQQLIKYLMKIAFYIISIFLVVSAQWYLIEPGHEMGNKIDTLSDGDSTTCSKFDLSTSSQLLKATLTETYTSLEVRVRVTIRANGGLNFGLIQPNCDEAPLLLLTHDSSRAIEMDWLVTHSVKLLNHASLAM